MSKTLKKDVKTMDDIANLIQAESCNLGSEPSTRKILNILGKMHNSYMHEIGLMKTRLEDIESVDVVELKDQIEDLEGEVQNLAMS